MRARHLNMLTCAYPVHQCCHELFDKFLVSCQVENPGSRLWHHQYRAIVMLRGQDALLSLRRNPRVGGPREPVIVIDILLKDC